MRPGVPNNGNRDRSGGPEKRRRQSIGLMVGLAVSLLIWAIVAGGFYLVSR